jgi:hypothetical protein
LPRELVCAGQFPFASSGDATFNFRTMFDLNERHHLLSSANCSIDGPTEFEMYIACQITFGPEWFHHEHPPRLLEGMNR